MSFLSVIFHSQVKMVVHRQFQLPPQPESVPGKLEYYGGAVAVAYMPNHCMTEYVYRRSVCLHLLVPLFKFSSLTYINKRKLKRSSLLIFMQWYGNHV